MFKTIWPLSHVILTWYMSLYFHGWAECLAPKRQTYLNIERTLARVLRGVLEIRENIYKSLPPYSGRPLMPTHSYTTGMRYKAEHGVCCVCWNFSISWRRHAEGAFEGSYTNEIVLGQRLLGTVERMNKRRLKLRLMIANVWSFQNLALSCPPKRSRILSSKEPKVELAAPSSSCIRTFFGAHLQFSQFHPLRDSFFFFNFVIGEKFLYISEPLNIPYLFCKPSSGLNCNLTSSSKHFLATPGYCGLSRTPSLQNSWHCQGLSVLRSVM